GLADRVLVVAATVEIQNLVRESALGDLAVLLAEHGAGRHLVDVCPRRPGSGKQPAQQRSAGCEIREASETTLSHPDPSIFAVEHGSRFAVNGSSAAIERHGSRALAFAACVAVP